MNILQVSTFDIAGGAEKIAWTLRQAYHARGHNAWLAVGNKRGDSMHSNLLLIPNDASRNAWARLWRNIGLLLASNAESSLWHQTFSNLCNYVGEPQRWIPHRFGYEDVHFPGTAYLPELPPQPPDILHCHNLHGGYFDLRMLPRLSAQLPVVLTLHDAWLLSGHCAHSFDCERWRTGCGHCPDLTIDPAIPRDATAYNWKRKQRIYARSKLHVATPSKWLMQKVKQSMLSSAIKKWRVIPNGIDLSLFHPADSQAARQQLGLPEDSKLLLFTANSIRENLWKDYHTMRDAIQRLAEKYAHPLLFLALGDTAPTEFLGKARIQFIPYIDDPVIVARYYQAADIYIHASRVDTFPTSVLEALACGTPVVATMAGGIPEQVDSGNTGLLVPAGDAAALASAIQKLLTQERFRKNMGRCAAETAERYFGAARMADEYLDWYQDILQDFPKVTGC